MNTGTSILLRRTFALLALLGTLSGAVAPVCAAPMAGEAPASRCDTTDDQGMPGHDSPTGAPAQHHTLMICASGICTTLVLTTPRIVAVAVPGAAQPPFAAGIPASATPQITTPPPRS